MLLKRNFISLFFTGLIGLSALNVGCGSNKVRQDTKTQQGSPQEVVKSDEEKTDPQSTQTTGSADVHEKSGAAPVAQSVQKTTSAEAGNAGEDDASEIPPPSAESNTNSSVAPPVQTPVQTPVLPAAFVDSKGRPISDEDLNSIKRCLVQFNNHPFVDGKSYKVKFMDTSISIAGFNFGGTDGVTVEPQLVLVKSGFNTGLLGGTPTLSLLNPNGFYCMKPQLNLNADMNIRLHCKAQLASSQEQFGVVEQLTNGIPFADSLFGSSNGISVNSSVEINRVCN